MKRIGNLRRDRKAENERERRRMATKTDTLTPQQAAAADLLAFGATVTDAAETGKPELSGFFHTKKDS
jgi:hypothetical protein